MLVNGLDLDGLAHDALALELPEQVPGRTVHIDADFLAYQVTAERADGTDTKTYEDMQHNAEVAVDTLRGLAAAEHVHMHLTPSTSDKGGRFKLAVQKPYQGNRTDKPKPRYLGIMREWLAKRYAGTLHQFCEADDGMSSSQYEALARGDRLLSVIASKDKDLAMVPGLHIDWDKGVIEDSITDFGSVWLDRSKTQAKAKGIGQKFFWAQMLMGDTADNIAGLPVYFAGDKATKVGPVKTVALLDQIHNNRQAFEFIKFLYEDYGTRVGFKHYNGDPVSWQKAMVSEMQLLWMRRQKHDPNDVLMWLKEIAS